MSNVPTTLILLLDSSYRGWFPRRAPALGSYRRKNKGERAAW